MLRGYPGAIVTRVVDRSHTRVPEHAHDWPVVSLYVIGSYLNETEIGGQFIAGPSVVYYRPGAAHRNTVAGDGFEQIEIEFDPRWLGRSFLPDVPVKRWTGSGTGVMRQCVMRACGAGGSEVHLRSALRRAPGKGAA